MPWQGCRQPSCASSLILIKTIRLVLSPATAGYRAPLLPHAPRSYGPGAPVRAALPERWPAHSSAFAVLIALVRSHWQPRDRDPGAQASGRGRATNSPCRAATALMPAYNRADTAEVGRTVCSGPVTAFRQ